MSIIEQEKRVIDRKAHNKVYRYTTVYKVYCTIYILYV